MPATTETILEIRRLEKFFPGVKAVDGVSFSIEKGICFGLLGPNGAGKTTTIEVIEGIQKPGTGEILYRGKSLGRNFKEESGIQFQNTELPQYLTVREVLDLFRSFYRKAASLESLVELCHLAEILDRDNGKPSGGQKQRLLLAMALANDPEFLFLDEPTTGLDPQARRHVWEIIRSVKARGKTIVLTTHYMDEAELLCDIIAIMDHGKIIAMGTPESLLKQHRFGNTITLQGDIDDTRMEGFPYRWFRTDGSLEIHTDSLNECIGELMRRGIDLGSLSVRSPNLEDLFIHLTGHNLRS